MRYMKFVAYSEDSIKYFVSQAKRKMLSDIPIEAYSIHTDFDYSLFNIFPTVLKGVAVIIHHDSGTNMGLTAVFSPLIYTHPPTFFTI